MVDGGEEVEMDDDDDDDDDEGMEQTENGSWCPDVLGLGKRELLAELLPIIGSNRALQRLKAEYTLSLQSVERS